MKKYMCGTTFEYELEWADDVALFIYDSIEDLKNKGQCWESCGIVEIDVDHENYGKMDNTVPHVWIEKENLELMFKNAKTMDEWEKSKK